MVDYQEFLDSINREAYHAGELTWEEDGYTCTRTYHYSPPGCHTSCGVIYYVKDNKVIHTGTRVFKPRHTVMDGIRIVRVFLKYLYQRLREMDFILYQ